MALKKVCLELKMDDDSSALYEEMQKKLIREYEKKLKGVHNNKLCQCKDGRWKTKNPQIVRQSREELLESLYNHYFGYETLTSLYPQFIEDFTALVKAGHRSPRSTDKYNVDWNRFLKGTAIAEKSIGQITVQELHSFYASITAHQAISKTTLNNVKTLVNHLFHKASNMGIDVIASSMVSTEDLVCSTVDNSDCVYTSDMRSKIIAVAEKIDTVYSRAIVLMFCLCVRIGELRALSWRDVDFERKAVRIHSQVVEVMDDNGTKAEKRVEYTKGKKETGKRMLPLSERAIEILNRQYADNPNGEYIFVKNGSEPLDSAYFNKILKNCCEKANVPYFSSHKIRFWAITEMYENNVPFSQIQRSAGHSSPTMTEHYIRMISEKADISENIIQTSFN
ncbi:MAG: site-specific integrase [Lachnospiraceae bacterium]|nr:site-specific integrase [Lachnospiraceae bacterium]